MLRRSLAAIFVTVVLATSSPANAQMIDRVLAVVGGTVITQSDADASLRFGLVSSPRPDQDPVRSTLDQLIPREIVLTEVNRSSPAEPNPIAVDRRMAAIRGRFASFEQYRAALDATGMTEERLRSIVSDNLRIEQYEQERFGAVVEPSDGEVADYYAEHRAEFARANPPMSAEQAAPIIRQRLTDARRAMVINEWVERLRRRVDVNDVYFADIPRPRK